MTDPQHVTAAQAADPSIPLQLLADVAAERPDLRTAVAGNPAAYPALLEWLGSLGDAEVDAALDQRSAGHSGGGGEGSSAPTGAADSVSSRIAQYGAPPGASPAPSGSGSGQTGFAPLGAAGRTVTESGSPYLPVPRPAPYTQPDGAYYPPPGTTDPARAAASFAGAAAPTDASDPTSLASGYPGASGYANAGAPYASAPYAGTPYPGAPYGQPAYGAPAPWEAPPQKRSNKPVWIAVSVIGVLFLAVIALFVVLAVMASNEGSAYGEDASLDALHDACAAGDMQACDDLYFAAPWGSEYEDFGDTCGGRTEGFSLCTTEDFG